MPPPPAAPLSPNQIGVSRAWIAAGAPRHCEAGELLPNGGASNEGAAGTAHGARALALGGATPPARRTPRLLRMPREYERAGGLQRELAIEKCAMSHSSLGCDNVTQTAL